jgi:heme oxygenase
MLDHHDFFPLPDDLHDTHSVLVDDIDNGNQLASITAARDSRYTSSLHESCETLRKHNQTFLSKQNSSRWKQQLLVFQEDEESIQRGLQASQQKTFE